ncbi:autotransporter domain-containing protein [Halopseudomonas sp.]|uniref:autotransporter outer membrane beta-barrel domain-containing protein n=1 Tax=Halopseudomonas sp. TaxID=2901191 RepID=UPI00311D3007
MIRRTCRQHWFGALLLGVFLAPITLPAHAAKCSTTGRLIFLGKTADLSQSVWLSGTGSGAFDLEAPGNNVVDSWTRSRSGLHLSLSPVVSNGSGPLHTLLDVTGVPCVLDRGTQKGGIIFPPALNVHPEFPIGKLPPDLITPEQPIGVRPPIGTLPPATITPEVPVASKPPIGVLPPETITPEVPVGVIPPIGTLPPVTITPEVPVASKPPIGVLPPEPITPEVPVGVRPPIGIVPPETITPEVPVAVRPPIGTLPPDPIMPVVPMRELPPLPALDGGELEGEGLNDAYKRRFLQAPKWNFWADNRLLSVTDRRGGSDLDGYSGYIMLGGDYRVASDLAVGALAFVEHTGSDAFGGDWEVDSDGISFGPYLAYRLSPHWTMDAAYTYGRLSNDNRLAVLRARYDTERHSLRVNASGQYVVNEFILVPEFALSYSQYQNEGHQMKGVIYGQPISLSIKRQHLSYGSAEGGLRVIRGYRDRRGGDWFPYAELSVINEFQQPYDGDGLIGKLIEDAPRWRGALRLGLQASPSPATRIDGNLGYLSIGQHGLDVWEGRLVFSYQF